MSYIEKEKEQEIDKAVSIFEQLDLPDIVLLTRDANTLLMRKKESENNGADLGRTG